MTLNEKMGYNKNVITIWEKQETDQKDEIGRPKYIYLKHIVKGRWEDEIKTIRKNGTEVTSVAKLIIPINPLGKELLYEKGEAIGEMPSYLALKSISIEAVSRLRRNPVEWIVKI